MNEQATGQEITQVPDDLPGSSEVIETATATLVFVAQKWRNDQARTAFRRQFEVPLADLRDEDSSKIRAHDKSGDWDHINGGAGLHHWVSDGFRSHSNAPDIAAAWDGPFVIKVVSWGHE